MVKKKLLNIFMSNLKPKLWKVVGSLGIGIFVAILPGRSLQVQPFSLIRFFYVLITFYVLWSLLDVMEAYS